jgi:hypothetical protein
MQRPNSAKSRGRRQRKRVKFRRRWRRKALAEYWGVSDRTIDRMRRDGRLGQPLYPGGGRWPSWSDEQIEACEATERAEPLQQSA